MMHMNTLELFDTGQKVSRVSLVPGNYICVSLVPWVSLVPGNWSLGESGTRELVSG